ncbi:MAG: DUF58 domain-containing protein [Proteobacteria bacterium]|nr:MAG: DUF58 domain-containing protein [Pseudomonadota bacterium]
MDPRHGRATALAEIARAARILAVRSRREAAGLLVGQWRSAFRGGGVEFEESRPYAPGDDVRAIDWNATARTGVPWVKRFREERSCPVLIALDVSASMAFGTAGRSKAEVAATAAALLATAAAQAGDPVGFAAFADGLRAEVTPGRGDAHTWRVIRAAAESAERPRGETDLRVAAEWIRAHGRRRSLAVVLSDFRGRDAEGRPFAVAARRHDLVAAVVEDRRERELVAAGGLRLVDAERGGRSLRLATRAKQREAYAAAAAARRETLVRRLREEGAEVVWLATDADPLRPLVRFFRTRAAPRRGVR